MSGSAKTGSEGDAAADSESEPTAASYVPTFSASASSWGGGPARDLTAVSVEGELGASYTVYSTNWDCPQCKAPNYPNRNRCHRCRAKKPADADSGRIVHARENPWREIFDPNSRRLYYVNSQTNETQWERPEAMGAAPHATGWFGRGAAGSDAANKYEEQNKQFLERPAKKQAENVSAKNTVLEGANEYNIWYNKYMGDHWDNKRGKDPAESRCDLLEEAGYTKADKATNSDKFFCLYFVKGQCAYGHQCNFLHRIPVKDDVTRLLLDELHDAFGRARHKDHRDDMDGVGCVMKPCRTLYVGSLQNRKYENPQALEAALWKHFGEWGEVENINLIARLSIAFVRYRYRCGAEIGREAMGNQALDHGEVLNVKWAYDDPNPVAIEAAKRADVDAVVNMMAAKGVTIGVKSDGSNGGAEGKVGGIGPTALPHQEVSAMRPDDYEQPAPKRIRMDGGEGTAETAEEAAALDRQYAEAGVVYYPDTDTQYSSSAAGGAGGTEQKTETVSAPPSQYAPGSAAEMAAAVAADVAAMAGSVGAGDAYQGHGMPGAGASGAWQAVTDPTTGQRYYHNPTTGQTSWTLPSS